MHDKFNQFSLGWVWLFVPTRAFTRTQLGDSNLSAERLVEEEANKLNENFPYSFHVLRFTINLLEIS